MRNIVKASDKYKPLIESIEVQKQAFKYAEEHPEEYLKAMLKSKLGSNI